MRIFYIVCLATLLTPGLFAQSQISGKVVDQAGQSLPGVNVQIKNTNSGTATDVQGLYSINAPTDAILIFSFIGFKSIEVPVAGKATINVTLEEDVLALGEVVVIGYGVQKKSVATASVSRVNSKDLQGFSSGQVDQILQGQVAGVTFKSSSGQPGSAQNIFIRGVGTNGNNNPLVIIDGMTSNDGVLSSLNPADIESIQVLKDGASTAIYGSRAANGIIMVTTKKAKAGEATFNYSFFYGQQKPWRIPEMMNASQYVDLITEKYQTSNIALPPGFPTQGSISTNTNWMEEVFEPGRTQTHQLSISKGTDKSSIFSSLSYFDQKGVIAPDKSNAKRVTARINSEQQINEYISFGQNMLLTYSENNRIPENNAFGSPLSDAFAYDPITPVYDENGTFGFAQSAYVQKEYINPLSRIFISNTQTSQESVLGNAYLKISPIKNLFFKTDLGIDYNRYDGNGFSPSYEFFDVNGNKLSFENQTNDVYQYASKAFIWQWENYVNYAYSKGKHNGDITLGTTARERQGGGLGGSSSNLILGDQLDPNFQYINNTPDSSRLANGVNDEREALWSLFGRINYNFDERYLFSVTLRRDGSSKFGPNERYGIFPSVSAGWIVSREQFWSISQISFLKLRASYGVNGNDRIGNLGYLALVARTANYPFGKPGSQIIVPGYSTPVLDNPNLKWEESKQFDIGLEIGLFDDQLKLEMDYYKKTTSDLLMTSTIGWYTGSGAPTANVGEVVNQGFELEATFQKQFGDVNFSAGLNFATLKNRVTKVTDDGYIDGYTWPVRNTVISRMEVGQPIGYFYGYKTGGVFADQDEIFAHIDGNGDLIQPNASPGDLKFIDTNGDGIIDANDRVNIGNPWPSVNVGLNLAASWKGFDLRLLFAGSFGNDVFRAYERQDVPLNNYQTDWLDRWTETNTGGSYPRVTYSDPNNNGRASDFYVEDGSYVRLKNLQIGYTIPTNIVSKAKLRSLRVYTTIDNLLTITGYTGFDPEIGINNGWVLDTAIDKGFYPQLRTIGFGLNASF